ncbi:hypothetical protein BDN70DRAFT_819814 [Pholiota conissans]|uniref:DASH complex subunit DUO1 n=1 Tax=Pholiota conissans TaxID=109636 RepID=A0A9P6CSZ6_9AGAR|nr:hypothetical protein BDN70DRAFT_819814 [Pholiota conissans]
MAIPRRDDGNTDLEIDSEGGEIDVEDMANVLESDDDDEETRIQALKRREEKLQSDIFILKKINSAFESFNDALQDTGSANQRIVTQLEQTDALLNKYINILSTSEDFARLVFDEQWRGAEADEEIIERERIEAAEKKRREAEAEAMRVQQELVRIEKEKQEAIQRKELARIEREKSERAIRGGIRGVRGTRASMRGVRGSTIPPRPSMCTESRVLLYHSSESLQVLHLVHHPAVFLGRGRHLGFHAHLGQYKIRLNNEMCRSGHHSPCLLFSLFVSCHLQLAQAGLNMQYFECISAKH